MTAGSSLHAHFRACIAASSREHLGRGRTPPRRNDILYKTMREGGKRERETERERERQMGGEFAECAANYPFIRRVISPAECIGRMFHKGWAVRDIYVPCLQFFRRERRGRPGRGWERKRKYGNSRDKYEPAPEGALSSGGGGGEGNGVSARGEPVAGIIFRTVRKRTREKRRYRTNEGRKEGSGDGRSASRSHPLSLSPSPASSPLLGRRRSALKPPEL